MGFIYDTLEIFICLLVLVFFGFFICVAGVLIPALAHNLLTSYGIIGLPVIGAVVLVIMFMIAAFCAMFK